MLRRNELFSPEVTKTILRPKNGDPKPSAFLPRDEFKFIVVCKTEHPPPLSASECLVVRVVAKRAANAGISEAESLRREMAEARDNLVLGSLTVDCFG